MEVRKIPEISVNEEIVTLKKLCSIFIKNLYTPKIVKRKPAIIRCVIRNFTLLLMGIADPLLIGG